MAVRCSACGQWIKTTGGAHNCPGSSKAKEEEHVILNINSKDNEHHREGDSNYQYDVLLLHYVASISAT
ncbi:hypothetical protein N7532_001403 [Penicillium argentinense]|uniref:Uncharacterized protein n=1 Tax=Penicillium argentinense TaxID=1131581 RepID=A0A9W9G2P1_9EURO|nr:uncharacterized protein N7532_001403 [Penicillium argentinense]KAJ5110868.1 hypothetical protein N7532_001403 [Penicillium argentinense]